MSFSKEIKEELSKLNNLARKNEVKYEFFGYLESDNISIENKHLKYSTENDYNINRFAKLIHNLKIENFNINTNGKKFFIEINQKDIPTYNLNLLQIKEEEFRAFIRGIFMGAGSINNPEKKYHLELKLSKRTYINGIIEKLKKIGINLRNTNLTLYIKDGEEISKFLAFLGANKSVLKFEEIRVQKHMNNKVNRLVNCETANLNKVLNASIEQVNAIKEIKKNGIFKKLDKSLQEIAELRLKYPDISLNELGQKMNPKLGKSGVNYRLKKIIQISKM